MHTATSQVHRLLGGDNFYLLESPSLRLEKFVNIGNDQKKDEIQAVVQCMKNHSMPAKKQGYDDIAGMVSLVQKLRSRLIVNQAGGILENAGLCLHRHFGFPYIPGSAVKGAARHYAWQEWMDLTDGEKREEADQAALKLALTFGYPTGNKMLDNSLKQIAGHAFGTTQPLESYAGSVVFMPAQPLGATSMITEIVNCHHMQYYTKESYRTKTGGRALDNEPPNPQFFPAVEEGSTFIFTLLPVSRDTHWAIRLAGMEGFDPVTFAVHCLQQAITINGMGAKTSAGYGWFQEDEKEASRLQEVRRRQEEQKAKERLERERQDRLKVMSPEDRRVEEMGQMSSEELKVLMKKVGTLPEFEQLCLLRAIRENHLALWKEEKKAKGDKARQRSEAILSAAARLGVEMP